MHVVIWAIRASSSRAVRLAGLAIGAMASSSPADADDATSSVARAVPDKSGYSLFNPTPDDEMRKFANDLPTKGYSVRTVDAGHFEPETDIFNYTYANYLGVITLSIQTLDPTLKLGVTNWMDIEVQFNGFQSSQSFDATSGGSILNGAGFGDVFLRTKMNLPCRLRAHSLCQATIIGPGDQQRRRRGRLDCATRATPRGLHHHFDDRVGCAEDCGQRREIRQFRQPRPPVIRSPDSTASTGWSNCSPRSVPVRRHRRSTPSISA